MKSIKNFTFIILVLFIKISIACAQINLMDKSDSIVLTGPYLGQELPGLTPEIFAIGVISTDVGEMCSIFNHGGDKFLFLRYDKIGSPGVYTIYITEFKEDKWSALRTLDLKSEYMNWDYNFAPDDQTFYFTSLRPTIIDGKASKRSNIWKTEITALGISEPQVLDGPINTAEYSNAFPTFASNGTMYFVSHRNDGFGESDLYRSKSVDGKYMEVENLGNIINTEFTEFDPFISADESYLLFCSNRPGAFKGVDIYVSFRNYDNTWTNPKNLGKEVNLVGGVCPNVTPDGKYLFFTGYGNEKGSEIYWMESKIIEKLKP